MSTTTITKQDLCEIVTTSVREALSVEMMKLRALALPYVSNQEQREIEKALRKGDDSTGKTISVAI